ncbi:hypothetical protein [Uliginosibacterium gangwonense]|uniref:hypothetical protein n=1 Tax=Uliginosibacterium gangwonense TaxID=392736 RepID=UPI00035FE412|nr:hypothetical protein [Uliginosibacterium gangwonense]
MSSVISIPQNALSSVSSINPVTFPFAASETQASSTVLLDTMSSIVQLSALGQVVTAGASLEASIQSLQANPSEATPSNVLAKAENFVTEFNQTQNSIGKAQPLLDLTSNSALIDQFAQTLNVAATSSADTQTSNLASLQTIGITPHTSSASVTTPATTSLTINENVLNTAVAANPAASLALLSQATQPLLQQVAQFEAQATTPGGLANDTTVAQSVGVPINLLQNLSADTALNSIQLSDLDLAAAGLDANTIQQTRTALNGSLSATLATAVAADSTSQSTSAQVLPKAVIAPAVVATVPTPESLVTTAPAPATPTVVTAEAVTVPTVTPLNSATTSTTIPTITISANTEDQTAFAAAMTLQNLASDPQLNAIFDNAFNPFYSAIISVYHQNDIGMQSVFSLANVRTVIPAPLSAVDRIHGINGYDEANNGFGSH